MNSNGITRRGQRWAQNSCLKRRDIVKLRRQVNTTKLKIVVLIIYSFLKQSLIVVLNRQVPTIGMIV